MFRPSEPLQRHAKGGRAGAALIALAVGVSALSGCTAAPPADSTTHPTSSVSVATPTPRPIPTATPAASTPPSFRPEGSATDNLPYFTSIVTTVWSGPDDTSGRAYIDALVAAGFDKRAMQVTNDESTVGNPAESIQFSVLWAGECLVGQVGPATGAPVTAVLPVVGPNACLIGETRPIDW